MTAKFETLVSFGCFFRLNPFINRLKKSKYCLYVDKKYRSLLVAKVAPQSSLIIRP